MRRWSEVLIWIGCTAAAFGALTSVQLNEAEACGGSPPPPDCGVAVNCALAVTQTAPNSDTPIDAEYDASLYVTVTGAHPACRATGATADFDIQSNCIDVATEDQGPGGTTALSTSVLQGLNEVPLTMTLPPGDDRYCFIDGDVQVTLDTGQSVTAKCAEQTLCTGPPTESNPDEPKLDLSIKDGGIVTATAGEPETLIYELTNNTDHNFDGVFLVESENTERPLDVGDLPPPDPNPDEVCTDGVNVPDEPADCSEEDIEPECGCDGVSYPNACERDNAGVQLLHDGACEAPDPSAQGFSLSMVGEGDNMPISFTEDSPDDSCIAMPANPANYTQPAISKVVNVPAGETIEVKVDQRSWGLCADGSCSRTSASATGSLGGETVQACGGASFVVVEKTSGGPEDSTCEDSGTTPGAGVWNDPDEPNFDVGDQPDLDDDGVPDYIEEIYDLDPLDPNDPEVEGDYNWNELLETDSDGNGIPDAVEIAYGYDPLDPTEPENPSEYTTDKLMGRDTDGDGVSDYEEIYIYGSDLYDDGDPDFYTPYSQIDTDGDGVPDYIEIAFGYDPLDPDEPANPDDLSWDSLLDQDSDGNGVSDGVELAYGYDPLDPDEPADPSKYTDEALQGRDSDGDGISDYDEIYEFGTDPLNADTDGDGFDDGEEVDSGTDPLNPHDPATTHSSNTPLAGIIFDSNDDDLDTLLFTEGSSLINVDAIRSRATALTLTAQISRVYETITVDPDSLADDGNVEINTTFDARPLLESSPYAIDRLQLGEKQIDDINIDTYLTGAGLIRLDSSPHTIFEYMYRLSAWVRDSNGDLARLQVGDEYDLTSEGDSIMITLNVDVSDYEFDELYLMHDFNSHERLSYEEVCNDGMDNTGNGLTDCDDPYCADDPVCSDRGGNDNDGDDNDGNDDDDDNGGNDDGNDDGNGNGNGDSDDDGDGSGAADDGSTSINRACASTNGNQPVGLALLILIGMAAVGRRRRQSQN